MDKETSQALLKMTALICGTAIFILFMGFSFWMAMEGRIGDFFGGFWLTTWIVSTIWFAILTLSLFLPREKA